MSLSFRELAAIALRVIPATGPWNTAVQREKTIFFERDDIDAAKGAQDLAKACCDVFGHNGLREKSPSTDASPCQRCGLQPDKEQAGT